MVQLEGNQKERLDLEGADADSKKNILWFLRHTKYGRT